MWVSKGTHEEQVQAYDPHPAPGTTECTRPAFVCIASQNTRFQHRHVIIRHQGNTGQKAMSRLWNGLGPRHGMLRALTGGASSRLQSQGLIASKGYRP